MAETLKDIRRRIGSVKNTQQITKAMKMVAAAKLKKAETRARSFAPYAKEINTTLRAVISRMDEVASIALAQSKTEEGALVLVVAGDRGLCGGFNAGLFRQLDGWARENADANTRFVAVGRKAVDWVNKKGYTLADSLTLLPEPPLVSNVDTVQSWLSEPFLAGEVGKVYVAYNRYRSPLVQEPTIEQVLPFETGEFEEGEVDTALPFLTDVDPQELIQQLVEDAFRALVNTVLLDNQAGEHGARMTAMDSATNNASDMVSRLTVRYNRARQAAITNELMDIVNGANSVK